MRTSRGAVSAAVLTAVLALAACTGSSGTKPTTSASTPQATTSAPSVAPTTTPPTTSKPTPVKTTVPVDQIPPGNPASWVPAGVPTTAKYKEPGDVVPRFTQDMFKNTVDGAAAAMGFYFEANNWDVAVGSSPLLITLICPQVCSQDVADSKKRARLNEHLIGGRYRQGEPIINRPPANHKASWAGQFPVTITAGRVVDARNKEQSKFKTQTFRLELDAKMVDHRWKIVGIYFAQ